MSPDPNGAIEAGKSYARSGYKRGKQGIVYVITSDKVIQAVLTGSVVGVVLSLNEGLSAYVQRWLVAALDVFIPVKLVAAVGSAMVFVLAYWADQNTEEWREWVREKTGEDTSEDTASAEDVTGEEKEG